MAFKKTFPEPQPFSDKPRPPIALLPVTSQKVAAVGYDAATQTLAVTFPNGKAIYHYPGVTPEQHAAFIGAESIGRHFGQHIQGRAFEKFPVEPAKDAASEAKTESEAA